MSAAGGERLKKGWLPCPRSARAARVRVGERKNLPSHPRASGTPETKGVGRIIFL